METELLEKKYVGEMIALSQDDERGTIYAIMMINELVLFERRSGIWIQLPSDHEEFDDLFGTSIDMARADEFLALYDRGDMTVPVADAFQI
jgi:hypothetical protein